MTKLERLLDASLAMAHERKLNQKTAAMLQKHAQELKLIALAHPKPAAKRLNRLVDLLAKEAGSL